MKIIEKWQGVTVKIEPWWTLIGAPVIQEFIFRFLPFQLYLVYGRFYEIGILSSLLFVTIHWYFNKWFVLYSFLWGLILWVVMANYGFMAVVVLHGLLNVIHLWLGILPNRRKS
ncbi:MAG: CPBP family intramembrane metalloprotease [bacterium]|nr:CPBP family intramembrane metalloprotease [bacterium]